MAQNKNGEQLDERWESYPQYCMAASTKTPTKWCCTLPPGHLDDHKAGGTTISKVFHTWPQVGSSSHERDMLKALGIDA